MEDIPITVEEQDARLALDTAKLKAENEIKQQQIEQLEILVAQRRALLERMRAAVKELDEENARIERDVEQVLARAA